MSKHAEWIEDLLGAAKANPSQGNIALIESCGVGCARRQHAFEDMKTLGEQASGCKTKEDYVAFLRHALPLHIEDADDGIIIYLGKKECTCPMASEIHANKEMLCHCTCGHEKAAWSVFFRKPVDVEIVESFQRGGNDCVIKIKM